MNGTVPHYRTVVGFCIAAICGYSMFSVWAVFYADDPTLTGDVVGTWKSFCVAAFGFWIGSSSAGKAKDDKPASVTVENPPENPVHVDMPDPAFGKATP